MRAWRGALQILPVLLMAAVMVPSFAVEKAPEAWLQWGGPTRDFRAPARDIATVWPESGPERLWSRDLGEGNSAILFDAGRLYTMYREGGKEIVICLDASSGTTIWEFGYQQATRNGHVPSYGSGPSSTPVISGDLLFTIGVAGKMHALNKHDGTMAWSHDIWDESFTGKVQIHGYSSSPLVYEDMVIVPVGGEEAGLVAFNQENGAIKWKAQDFNNSYSSPRLMEIAGEKQVVVFMAEELIGVNPDNGELRWRYPHVNQWNHNITVPEISGDTIFLSSPQAGARGIRLSRLNDEIQVEEIWSTRRIQFYHGSSIREGDWVYGSTGTVALNFMAAVNIHTGEIGWRQRGFARANCVEADGRLVVLDEDGMLYLTSVTPEKLTVHASTQLLSSTSWTVPTIVGKTLFARNNKTILAVNLG
jgi:outer membrane protein assembly factor BamB